MDFLDSWVKQRQPVVQETQQTQQRGGQILRRTGERSLQRIRTPLSGNLDLAVGFLLNP